MPWRTRGARLVGMTAPLRTRTSLPGATGAVQSALRSHGWSALPIFRRTDGPVVTVGMRTASRDVALTLVDAAAGVVIDARVHAGARLMPVEARELAREILGLDIALDDYWARCRQSPRHRWVAAQRVGNQLRAPSLLDDLLILVCTVNCTWGRAVTLVQSLAALAPAIDGLPVLPDAATIVAAGEATLRARSFGYRARHLSALAHAAVDGAIPSRAALRAMEPMLARKALVALPGVGPYVAETALRIVGVHDFYGMDSWNTTCVPEAADGEAALHARYDRVFGTTWRGLAYWCDATRSWHGQKKLTATG